MNIKIDQLQANASKIKSLVVQMTMSLTIIHYLIYFDYIPWGLVENRGFIKVVDPN